MKKVLSENIMNLEDYLLTASARHKYSELLAMELTDLWDIHDNLITTMKGIL
jgi:hypothetical protein